MEPYVGPSGDSTAATPAGPGAGREGRGTGRLRRRGRLGAGGTRPRGAALSTRSLGGSGFGAVGATPPRRGGALRGLGAGRDIDAVSRGELGKERVAGARTGDGGGDSGLAGEVTDVGDLRVGHQGDHGAGGA